MALPPGRLKLATRPSFTGSPPVTKTMGIVVVAALAASAERVFPKIRATWRRTRSAARAGNRSGLIFRPAKFDRDVLTLDKACFLQALAERGHEVPSQRARRPRNPITGIAGCCARAASGQPPPRRRAA